VTDILEPEMSDEEQQALHHGVEVLKNATGKVAP
jgi:hypothetical protein